MKLGNKFGGQPWFDEAVAFFSSRFPPVEDRLRASARYVEFRTDNRSTFSYEFASILRDSGGIFGSVLDALVRGYKSANTTPQYHFGHFREFLEEHVPDIERSTVVLRSQFPAGLFVPFEEMSSAGGPEWWDAHNAVEHREYYEFQRGNLENTATAVAGLVILGFLMGAAWADDLFVNIGTVFPTDAVDLRPERRLFPPAATI